MNTGMQKQSTTSWAMVLLALAALLAAGVLYMIAERSTALAQAEQAVARATQATSDGPNDVNVPLAEAQSAAEALKKDNLFAPPPPKQSPVREVLGILGDEALINDKWYKAGDSVGDARIVAVEPTTVRVSWNGQETEFAPLGAGGPGGGAPSGGPGPRRARPDRPRPAPGGPATVRVRDNGPPALSAEERAELRNRFREASPEERAKLREEMRQRMGRLSR